MTDIQTEKTQRNIDRQKQKDRNKYRSTTITENTTKNGHNHSIKQYRQRQPDKPDKHTRINK